MDRSSEIALNDQWRPEKEIRDGIRSILKLLLSACARSQGAYDGIARGVDSVDSDALLTIFADLRHVERLLAVLISGAGALGQGAVTHVVWSLALGRECLQTFLLRRLFDLGHQLQRGVDPNTGLSAVPLAPSSLEPRDLAHTTKTMEKLREALRAAYERCNVADDSALPSQRSVLYAFDKIAELCIRTIQHVGNWLGDQRLARVAQFQDDWASTTDPGEKMRLLGMLNAMNTAVQMTDDWRTAFPHLPESMPPTYTHPFVSAASDLDAMPRVPRAANDDRKG